MTRSYRDEIPRPAIADVLQELAQVEAIPLGRGWVRLSCPFHEDRRASASINHDDNGFKCHSCGRSGDGLKLLQTELHLTFKQACDKARLLSGETTNNKTRTRKRRVSDIFGSNE